MFSTIPLAYNEKEEVLTIGKREGEFPGMQKTRVFEIVWLGRAHSAGLNFDSKPDVTVTYDGNPRSITVRK